MRIISPSIEVLDLSRTGLFAIEDAGRTCYRSEDRKTLESAPKFAKMMLDLGHHAMLEFATATVRIVTSRGVTHELVRHRIASYAQESTRYCDYSREKYGGLEFVRPSHISEDDISQAIVDMNNNGGYTHSRCPKCSPVVRWFWTMREAEETYAILRRKGWTPEQARGVLPNDLRAEIVVKMNWRQWLHFFKLRTAKDAHPDIRQVAEMILEEFQKVVPEIFGGGDDEDA